MKFELIKRINLWCYRLRKPFGTISLLNYIAVFYFLVIMIYFLAFAPGSLVTRGIHFAVASGILLLFMFYVMTLTWINEKIETKYPNIRYSPYGTLFKWYDRNYKYNQKKNWLSEVAINLLKLGIDLNLPLILISPSGNKGKYEKDLASKFPQSKFVVTDYEIPFNHEQSQNNFMYLNTENNALDIKEYLSEIGIDKVDVIWDIKGALWYSANPKVDKNMLMNLLKAYYSVLSNNGSIVIDAYDYNPNKFPINDLKRALRIGYLEASTFSKIKRRLLVNEEVSKLFEVKFQGEGLSKIVQLKKVVEEEA